MSFEACHLSERAVLSVSGPDAESLLQSLVTNDVGATGDMAYGALLSPQGKIMFDFFILKDAGRYLIDCAASQCDELLKRLGFYRLRAKVALAKEEALKVAVSPDEGIADPRWPGLGFRSIAADAPVASSAAYHRHRIINGIADTDQDLSSGDFFPHEANFDQLNGVSFTKGCYVGQEIVSRMEHRGTARSRILPVDFEGAAPAKETSIEAGGKSVGSLLSSAGANALAIIRLDKLQDALSAGEALAAGGRPLQVKSPPWARFHVPQPRAA
jgi:tRNA-modifying protein YgfZ